ncbi:metal ABC transporter substrate-binding protein [uncultured Cohaesibacter sp.]|uniref:metal ABC transporter substrate-binding protein n=1 Tax=uncultured Cohaesibacter sp. TaxID=1002546 RepID=UPI00292F0AB2|nr:metal ABC transporter substrate-binding protein [uncultured Cohaesibacter sp.]
MKAVNLSVLSFVFVVAFLGSAQAGEKFKVVTTFTILADMARNVTGDLAEVESITKPGAGIHDYQATPRDMLRGQGADLILWNGLNLERWFERFFASLRGVPSVVVTEGIEPMAIGTGPYKGKPNPHAWMSPSNALIYVDNIAAALVKYDPANASHYEYNAELYKRKIHEFADPVRDVLASIPDKNKWLVTGEGAFSYMARDFGLRELYLWPINADQQGTPKQVKRVIDIIRAEKIPAIFSESTVSDKPSRQVAEETGIKYGGVLYVDSLSNSDGPVPTYLDLLRVTSQTIADVLTEE